MIQGTNLSVREDNETDSPGSYAKTHGRQEGDME